MATLGTIIADFTTSLASAIAVGGTTGTLQSATDDDGVALPSGRYFFTIDGSNAGKEHISCDLSGTALTNIKSVSRQGVETTGTARAHRLGATVTITDFLSIKLINDMVSGVATFDADVPLGYDATATISGNNQFATKAYADGLAIAGAPDSSTSVKGIGRVSVAPVSAATPIFVGDNDPRIAPNNYGASAAGTDTYAITLSSAPAAYVAGQAYSFKADVANTGAATLNVNSLGAKTIKKNVSEDLVTGDIAANQIVEVIYDGTNMQLVSPNSHVTSIVRIYDQADSPATWTKPAGLVSLFVECWGAGGSGAKDSVRQGGSGGGGGYFSVILPAASLGSTETVTIGAGGAAKSSNGAGNGGGTTSFGSHVSCTGGGGGGYDAANRGNGASGGTGVSTIANTVYSGGTGGDGNSNAAGTAAINGGGGGGGGSGAGGASVWGGGGGGSAGNSVYGGVGGANGATGTAGTVPGGGGGSSSSGNSGAGAHGRCRVTEYY